MAQTKRVRSSKVTINSLKMIIETTMLSKGSIFLSSLTNFSIAGSFKQTMPKTPQPAVMMVLTSDILLKHLMFPDFNFIRLIINYIIPNRYNTTLAIMNIKHSWACCSRIYRFPSIIYLTVKAVNTANTTIVTKILQIMSFR